MTVSFLVPDISGPVLGPVTVLARTLQRHLPVQIVGPDFGHGVCPMYRGAFDYTVVPAPRLYRLPDFLWESRRLGAALTGDVIVAVKAFADTVPVALREKRRRGAKVVVYLDEWDGALFYQLPKAARWKSVLRNLRFPLEEPWHPWIERMIRRADLVISTSTWLQRKFGGRIVHMGVDTDFFRPSPPEQAAALKKECGLEGLRCIVFGGVVRPHKGIEVILDALVRLGRPDARFVIVGPVNEHVRQLQSDPAYRTYLTALGPQPAARMPEFLSLADLIVLPLKDNLLARTQMPCKSFEALAMGRPVIGSAVSDLPLVLEGCGRVVPPDDPAALAAAIADVLDHPAEARRMGEAAREKCIRLYSRAVTEQALVAAIRDLGAGRLSDPAKGV
ncbi:MAG: glycosyltransferase [Kiritimatiellae bacterium]|nr:glycosyltransferase [Kiritimatiellia bacterium]